LSLLKYREKLMLCRDRGFYEKYVKRVLDIICSVLAIVVFCWLYAIIAVSVRIKLGKPILFKQPRPGIIDPKTGKERIFFMYKFRTMTNEQDKKGDLLPDEERLTKFGRMLRATSLDELPEAFNILKGDMSVVGPRPQLVRDMVFMNKEQRLRHTAKPGLSGMAQVMGRNAITWEDKIKLDLRYIEKVSFLGDVRIVWQTFKKVFVRTNITESNEEIDVTLDYGDALLKAGKVTKEEYIAKQIEARKLLEEGENRLGNGKI
jgi:lipopolysaccharide/colanic/teichoic acid biosynthesis glycosyltransferase